MARPSRHHSRLGRLTTPCTCISCAGELLIPRCILKRCCIQSYCEAEAVRRNPCLPCTAHAAAHACLLSVLRHGSPECQDADALAVPAVPLYDSDDETTDSAVISALASKWTKSWAVAQPARQQEATRHMVQPKCLCFKKSHALSINQYTDRQPPSS
jgi:hypothetical protein